MANYDEMRKAEIEMFDITVKKLHSILIDHVKLYGNVFYRINDVFQIDNEELKQKIIKEAIELILK